MEDANKSTWLRRLVDRPFFRRPVEDVLAGLELVVTQRSPLRAFAPMLLSMVITWFVYVGIHELLHVLGCVATGGTVTRLEISATYGGSLYSRWFPFVVSGSEYAGRLSGFDTHGSDGTYLATDFGPFALTVLFGVALLKATAKKRRPILFGVAVVVGLAPFYNLPGDYFEMGSILTTRAVSWFTAGGLTPDLESLRSDDVFKHLTTLFTKPEELHRTGIRAVVGAVGIAGVSMLVGVW